MIEIVQCKKLMNPVCLNVDCWQNKSTRLYIVEVEEVVCPVFCSWCLTSITAIETIQPYFIEEFWTFLFTFLFFYCLHTSFYFTQVPIDGRISSSAYYTRHCTILTENNSAKCLK